MTAADAKAAHQEQIDACQLELAALRDRLRTGDITSEDFDVQQRDLAARLLAAVPAQAAAVRRIPRLPIAVGAIFVAGLLGWLVFGRHESVPTPSPAERFDIGAAASAPGPKSAHALSRDQLQRMVDEATATVQKAPKDAPAWAMLAHSQDMLGNFAESVRAYETLVRLVPGDAQLLADFADALAVANGRTLAGRPTELVKQALDLDPKNVKALTLAGTAAFELNDYGKAIASWQRARDLATEPDFRRQLDASIAAARAGASGSTSALAASSTTGVAGRAQAPALAASNAFVSGRVSLADALVAKAPPDATVFIFARPAQGSRMPVALLRRKVRDLPFDFRLDDSTAMVPGVSLSQQSSVVIGARVSQRGDVSPQPGDIQGWSTPVAPGTSGVKLEIGEVVK